jgi:nucleoside permease NupC
VVAAASPFIGQGENALLVRPFVKDMTKSEIHQIMASGFATISGIFYILSLLFFFFFLFCFVLFLLLCFFVIVRLCSVWLHIARRISAIFNYSGYHVSSLCYCTL